MLKVRQAQAQKYLSNRPVKDRHTLANEDRQRAVTFAGGTESDA